MEKILGLKQIVRHQPELTFHIKNEEKHAESMILEPCRPTDDKACNFRNRIRKVLIRLSLNCSESNL